MPWLLLAVVLGFAGWSGTHIRWIRKGDWAWSMPTWVLLGLESLHSPWMPNNVGHALASRAAGMTQSQQAAYARVLQHDLRDDDTRNNADRGLMLLEALGDTGVNALRRALDSDDWQARQLAAAALRAAWRNGPSTCLPDRRLIRVSVEALRDDVHLGANACWTLHGNAQDSFSFLLAVGRPAIPWLLHAIESDDPQQRVLAAALAAATGDRYSRDRAAPVLVAHLANNQVDRDARTSADALLRMGGLAIPHLTKAVDSADEQQRELARLIWMNIRGEEGIRFVDRRVISRALARIP